MTKQTASKRYPLCAAVSFWLLVVLSTICPAIAMADDVGALITAPRTGDVDVDLNSAIQWETVDGALAYYLYVGTTSGAKDLVDTGEIHTTQWPVSRLPAGLTVYARIYTKFASGWKSSEISFTTRAIALLTTPKDHAVDIDPRIAFQWTQVNGAQAYYLYVGTTAGSKDLVDTGEVQTPGFQPKQPLPAGKQLYARIYTKVGGVWRFVETTFTTAGLSLITSPTDGNGEVDPSGRITWSAVDGAQSYYLYVGSTYGAKDIVDTGEMRTTAMSSITSYSLASLPLGKTAYARVYTKFNNVWHYDEIDFRIRPAAVFIAPKDGAAEVPSTQVATWKPVDGAEKYYLTAGSTAGGRDYIDSGEITATSYGIAKLPIGATVYLRLSTLFQGKWRFVDATIGTAHIARLLSPVDGASNVARHSSIAWTPVPEAQAYYVYVGTSAGAKDLLNTGEISATSYRADMLPPGTQVFVRLWTKQNDTWRYSDSSFTTRNAAMLTGAGADGADISPVAQLQWQGISGADAYYVYVGSAPGLKDLGDSSQLSSTGYSLTGIAGGRPIYVRLYTHVNGVWIYEDYALASAPLAYLTSPKYGQDDVDPEQRVLTWTTVDHASAYRIEIGSSAGGTDRWVSPDLTTTSVQLPPLPGGVIQFVRVWAEQDGAWRSTDSLFNARSISQLKSPLPYSTHADLSQPFEWTSVADASAYSMSIGSSPGAADIVNTGPVTATSASVGTLPGNQPLYVRIGTLVGGEWRYLDAVVEGGGQIAAPAVVYPADGATDVDASTPFEWVRDPLAVSYRLTIGTDAQSSDVYDSGNLRINRRFVRGLPSDQTLYATLTARYSDGTLATTQFSFAASNVSIGSSAELSAAKWATSSVRSMAEADNVAHANTVVADVRRAEGKVAVNCESYATALLAIFKELSLSAPSRVLNICLNSGNEFDCHTLVEYFDVTSGRWALLDPTFGLTVRLSADGSLATALDVSNAARTLDWTALSYEYLTGAGDSFATGYYIDYPALYLNVHAPNSVALLDPPLATLLPYFDSAGPAVSNVPASYALQCGAGQQTVRATIDGQDEELSCSSADNLTDIFVAANIAPVDANTPLTIYRSRRFTF